MVGTTPLFVWIVIITAAAARIQMTSGFLFDNSNPVYRRENPDTLENGSAEACARFGLCDHFENYPTDVAEKLIEELGDSVKHLSMDELPSSDISFRTDSDLKIPLCPFLSKIVYPSDGVNKNEEPRKILNRKTEPVQGFRVDICKSDARYEDSIISFNEGWEGTCVQSYVYRTMTVIDQGDVVTTDEIKLPSTCSCYGYMIDN